MQARQSLVDLKLGILRLVVAHHMEALVEATIKIVEAKVVGMVQHKVEVMVPLRLVVSKHEELDMPVETLAMGRGVLILVLVGVEVQISLVMDAHSSMVEALLKKEILSISTKISKLTLSCDPDGFSSSIEVGAVCEGMVSGVYGQSPYVFSASSVVK